MVMHMSNVLVSLPEPIKRRADAYVASGLYSNRSELIREAVREYLDELGGKRKDVAIDLYRRGKVSLGFAAELYGVGYEKMRAILKEKGIAAQTGPQSTDEAAHDLDVAKKL